MLFFADAHFADTKWRNHPPGRRRCPRPCPLPPGGDSSILCRPKCASAEKSICTLWTTPRHEGQTSPTQPTVDEVRRQLYIHLATHSYSGTDGWIQIKVFFIGAEDMLGCTFL